MFHNVFRGFQFDFNPPAQGSLNLIICRKHILVQLINQCENNSGLATALQSANHRRQISIDSAYCHQYGILRGFIYIQVCQCLLLVVTDLQGSHLL